MLTLVVRIQSTHVSAVETAKRMYLSKKLKHSLYVQDTAVVGWARPAYDQWLLFPVGPDQLISVEIREMPDLKKVSGVTGAINHRKSSEGDRGALPSSWPPSNPLPVTSIGTSR